MSSPSVRLAVWALTFYLAIATGVWVTLSKSFNDSHARLEQVEGTDVPCYNVDGEE